MINFSSSSSSSSSSRQTRRNFGTSGRRYYASSSSTSSQNGSEQRAAVNIDSQNLELPYLLSVNISGTQLTGKIKVDGKVIKRLNNNNNQFNLSPYLSIGKNTIEVLAQYLPRSSSIEVEFLGSDTRVVQKTGGNGVLRYILTVMVT